MNKPTLKLTCITVFTIGLITSISSCKKDSDTNTPTPVVVDTAVYFDCKIGGVELLDDARFADYSGTGLTRIIAQDGFKLIRIDFPAEATGTFTLNNTNNNVITFVDSVGTVYKSTSGTITVSKYEKNNQKISGTFSGVVKQEGGTITKNVTEGKFNNVKVTPF